MAFQVSSTDLTALYTGIQLQVRDAYSVARPKLRGFAVEVMSENMREAYPIQAISATLERWSGSRPTSNLIQRTQYIDNGDAWSKKIAIKRKDIELKSRTLNMGTVSAQMGKAAKMKPDEIIVSLLQSGSSTACIDGVNFFSTSHPVVPWDSSYGTFSNYQASGFALNRTNFRAAYQGMLALRGWDLQSFEVDQFYLVVPPQLQSTAQEIVLSEFAGQATGGTTDFVHGTNIDKGKAKVVVSQKLSTEATTWYLLSVVQPPAGEIDQEAAFGAPGGAPLSGPFAIQMWRPLEIVPRFSLDSENVFERDEYEIGLSIGLEGGYLLPQHAFRATA